MMPNIDYKKESQIFKALGHPIRLAIIEALINGEKCVFAIQELLHVSQPNTSQHLNNLKYAGIVDFRQEANLRCYFLKNPKKMKLLINALK